LHLKIVGRRYHQEYFKLLSKKARGKDVMFVTDADDLVLRDLYQTSGLYIQASTYVDSYGKYVQKPELMGLTTLEALSSGMPAVVAATASLPELASDDRYSRVFRDVAELGEILIEYKHGAWPEAGAGSLARSHTVLHYSFPVVGEKIARFYADVHRARLVEAS
jgi:glycosyltransferase involved in cell wall biosynthesis